MWTHKAKFLVNQLQILVLMKFMLLNTHSLSIERNTWIMTIFASLTYFKLFQNKMEKLDTILYILVKGLIILGRPKTTLALVILNMNFCKFRVNVHNTLIITYLATPILLGYKKKPLEHLDGCWMIHHILQATNSENKWYLVPHATHIMENACVVQSLILKLLPNIEAWCLPQLF
jgi:hypothetical protein